MGWRMWGILGKKPNNTFNEASQAGSRERANFQQKIMRTPKIILVKVA